MVGARVRAASCASRPTRPPGDAVNRTIVRKNPALDGVAVAAAAAFSLFGNDWLFGAAIGVLWAIWRMLPDDNDPPILALAMTYQWVQVTAGMFYSLVTGRTLVP